MAGEPDYVARLRKKAHRPSTKKKEPRRVLVYGKHKKGKTRFGVSAGIEKTLVLDPEKGTDTMVALDPYVIPIDRWADMQDVWGALKTGNLSPKALGLGKSDKPFKYLSVDGLTKLNEMALSYAIGLAEDRDLLRKPGQVRKQDYGESGKHMVNMMTNLDSLPLGIIYTAQERMVALTDDGTGPEQEDDVDAEAVQFYYVANLPARARSFVYAEVDVIGRIYTVAVYHPKTTEKLAQRRLQIGIHEKYDTGYRSDFRLPDILKNPTMPKLEKLMAEGEL